MKASKTLTYNECTWEDEKGSSFMCNSNKVRELLKLSGGIQTIVLEISDIKEEGMSAISIEKDIDCWWWSNVGECPDSQFYETFDEWLDSLFGEREDAFIFTLYVKATPQTPS